MSGSRHTTTWIVIGGLVVLLTCTTGGAMASPLYGGYNGQSARWVELSLFEENTIGLSFKISIGADPDLPAWWSRVTMSSIFFLPYFYTIEFSYETGNIISANITPLFPWPVKFGADTANLQWAIVNLIVVVSGQDTNDTMWWERIVPGLELYASGWDNYDHQWQWIKLFFMLVGWRQSTELLQASSPWYQNFLSAEEGETQSLSLAKKYAPLLRGLLREKLIDPVVSEKLKTLAEALPRSTAQYPLLTASRSAECQASAAELSVLLQFAREEIFTPKTREEMQKVLEEFLQDLRAQSP